MLRKLFHIVNSGSRLVLVLLLALVATGMRGQQATLADTFIYMSPAAYPVDANALPTFAMQVPLGDATYASVQVEMEYPEYEALTASECAAIRSAQFQVPDTIVPSYFVAYARRRGFLDISLCPIVKHGEALRRLTSCKFIVKATLPSTHIMSQAGSAARSSERWKSASVLSTGRWVKVRVADEGIYRLTASQLATMGFNDPAQVKVYGYGGRLQPEAWSFTDPATAVPDDLCEVACFRQDGSLYFFAEGTTRWDWNTSLGEWIHYVQPYSNYSYYFITDEGDSPMQWSVTNDASTAGSPVIARVAHHAVIDDDAAAFYEGGRELYDSHNFATRSTQTWRLSLPGIVPDTEATATVAVAAASPSQSVSVAVVLNGTDLGTMSVRRYGSDESAYEARRTFTTTAATAESSFQLTTTEGIPARLNFIRVNYQRQLSAADDGLSFMPSGTGGAAQLAIGGADAATRLWRIGQSSEPTVEVGGTLQADTLLVPIADASRRYVVFNPAADYPSPQTVGLVSNQNLHADGQQDMVIIIPASGKLQAQAERLAQAHRQRSNLRVRIVRADELYNEFSSGTPDASAYRRYLKMLYDRAETEADMPSYLLLMGDCVWDNRMLTTTWQSHDPDDYLLAFEVSYTSTQANPSGFAIGPLNSYVTDDFFTWLDDGEGGNYHRAKPDVAVGRLPAHDEATMQVMVDKVLAYMDNEAVGSWKNRIYMLADDVNNNLHMEDAESIVSSMDQASDGLIQVSKVYWDAYPIERSATGNSYPQVTRLLQERMARGALMFNYMGHGSPEQVSSSRLLRATDFGASSSGRLPLWVLASCEITPYDRQESDIGRTALGNTDGGAVAVMCSSRSVYSNYNRALNASFSSHVLSTDAAGTPLPMGEALRRAKVDMVDDGRDVTMNKLKYVLLGDPALALSFPTATIRLDSINDQALGPDSFHQLQAGSVATFSGYVEGNDGQPDPSFTGTVTATVYDRLETITCRNNYGSATTPMVYADRTRQLYEGSDSVRAGRFTLRMPVPRDISYSSDAGHISLYAVRADRLLEAHGTGEQFCFDGTYAAAQPDTLGPEVTLYLDTPLFVDGGITSSAPTLYAVIADTSGINAAGLSPGHDIELIVDGDYSSPIDLGDYFAYDFGSYSTGTVTYPLSGLADGQHELRLRVWDIPGNSTTATLTFHVGGVQVADDGLTLSATVNPARTSTSFVLALTQAPGDGATYSLSVYDVAGRRQWLATCALSPDATQTLVNWDLCDGAGAPMGAGLYLVRAQVEGPAVEAETKALKLLIIR